MTDRDRGALQQDGVGPSQVPKAHARARVGAPPMAASGLPVSDPSAGGCEADEVCRARYAADSRVVIGEGQPVYFAPFERFAIDVLAPEQRAPLETVNMEI